MSVINSIDKVLHSIKNLKLENEHDSKGYQPTVARKVNQQKQKIAFKDERIKRRAILRQSRQRIRDSANKSKDYS